MKGSASTVLTWSSIANLCLFILVFCLGTWVAEDYPITTVIAYAPPMIWLVPALVLVACSFGKRNRNWLKLNAACLILFGWVLLGIHIPFRADRSGSEGTFTLMTFNMMSDSGTYDKVLDIIRENNPDVICLQEANLFGEAGYDDKKFPGYHVFHQKGIAVGTKIRPVKNFHVPLFPGYPGAVEVELPNGVRVVAVHLSYHRIGSVGRKAIPGHLQTVSKMHAVEVDMLATRYAGRPKVVIAGDFNLPPRGHIYSKMRQHFTDAFASAGWLTGYTWPSNFPVQRIDYAFTTDLKVQSAKTISSTVSNHLPVLFRFKL